MKSRFFLSFVVVVVVVLVVVVTKSAPKQHLIVLCKKEFVENEIFLS
jgi:hypothetical protein